MNVIPDDCTNPDGHRLVATEGSAGHVLFCERCGQAVSVSVAVGRTRTPTTFKFEPPTAETGGTSSDAVVGDITVWS